MRARLLACALALSAAACSGSTSTELTAPSAVKCEVTIQNALQGAAPAAGASSTLTLTTSRDCTWTATSDSSWLAITSGANGQGSGSVSYTVASNSQPAQRRATVSVNSTPTVVVQDGAPCRFTVTPANTSVSASGGQVSVNVEAVAGCTWTAQSAADWIHLGTTASGNGNGSITAQVAANDGNARSGTVTIAGNTVTVGQTAAACTFSVAPASQNIPFGGGSVSIAVTVRPGCTWTAGSGVSWATIASGGTGSGSGTVAVQVAANDGNARSGSLTIGGSAIAINQAAAPCIYNVAPLSQNVPVEGASGSAAVTVRSGCAWTAASGAPWIAITSLLAGNGNGVITFNVAPNSGPPRTGTLAIAGSTFTVSQATVPCDYSIGPRTQFIGPDGGTGGATIMTGPTCPWTAEPTVPWIVMIGAASGIGEGRAIFAIAPNLGDGRIGTVTIAGQPYTVYQGGRR